MSTATLATTISLAAIFGAALLWVAVYYLHRYIHRECCKIKDFFTSMVGPVQKQEDYSNERGESTLRQGTPEEWVREEERRRGDEIVRERAERDEERRREREGRKRDRARKKVEEWADGDGRGVEEATSYVPKTCMPPSSRRHGIEEEPEGGGGYGVLQQPSWPAYIPAFVPVFQSYGAHYGPANLPLPVLPWESGEGQHAEYELPPPQHYTNEIEEEPNSPPQPYLNAEPVETPVSSIAEAEDDVISISEAQRPASEQLMPRTDFIFVADEYPPYIRECLDERKKEREKARIDDSTSSSSPSSSADEEVPRGPIPTATQRPAFHFPQMPWRAHPPNIPRSYPRQWMPPAEPLQDDLPMYPPYANVGRNPRRERGDGRPRLAPRNERRFVPRMERRHPRMEVMQHINDYDYVRLPKPLYPRRLGRGIQSHPRPQMNRANGPDRMRLPRQPRRRPNIADQPVPLVFPGEIPMPRVNGSMVAPAEVEEPPEASQAPRDEPGPANNIEVEEVVQSAVDREAIQDQASPVDRQPILLGMPPSMSKHDVDVDPHEASPPAEDEEAPLPVENEETNEGANTERQEEQRPEIVPDGGPDDGVAGQKAVPSSVGGQPEKHEASPATFVSSLHASSVEQRPGGPSRVVVTPVGEGEQGNGAGSDLVSSFTWEQEP